MTAYALGDVVRLRTSRTDRIVVGIRAALPPAEYADRLARYEAGEIRSQPWPEVDMFVTRSLRDGRPFGPENYARADRLTLIRLASTEEN